MIGGKFNSDDFAQIEKILVCYFEGLYRGDVNKLSSIFHNDAWLKSPHRRRSLQQWLQDVAKRESPESQGRSFDFRVLAIDLVQDQAFAKIYCPLFDFEYIDFLGLLKENNKWLIVNKMFTDIKPKIVKTDD